MKSNDKLLIKSVILLWFHCSIIKFFYQKIVCMRFNINKNVFAGIIIIINNVEIETLNTKRIIYFKIFKNSFIFNEMKYKNIFIQQKNIEHPPKSMILNYTI